MKRRTINRRFKTLLGSFILLVIAFKSIGQDSLVLPTITIRDHFFPASSLLFNNNDSTAIQSHHFRDAGLFLDNLTPLYIRKYGPGLSYSLSVRGSNSAQVNILWNDIPINSPMQGQTDLALVHFTRNQRLEFDPNSYTHGLSGALSINDEVHSKKEHMLSLTETLRSTMGHQTSIYGSTSLNKLSGNASVSIINDLNRFSFNRNGEKIAIQNNALESYQFKLNLSYRIDSKHQFSINGWGLNSKRLIPPSLYETTNDAQQDDVSFKLNTGYKFINNRFSIKIGSALLYDKLLYRSILKSIDSNSRALSLVQSIKTNWIVRPKHHFSLYGLNNRIVVISNAYNDTQHLNELSVVAQYRYKPAFKHDIQLGLKYGTRFRDNRQVAPYIYYNYQINPRLGILVASGKKYRYPAVNDLFWYQGGNDQLQPENAFESEIGLTWQALSWLRYVNRTYQKNVNNWIQWTPEDGVYSARNLDLVKGIGTENSLHLQFKSNQALFRMNMIHQYTKITYGNGILKGKTLIYTPSQLFKSNYSVELGLWQVKTEINYTGKVFTTTDNSSNLDAYYLVHLDIEKKWHLPGSYLSAWFRMNNVFNTSYFSIENYVMPGRIFEIGINWKNNWSDDLNN